MKHANSKRRETTKKRHGKKFYAEIGSIGGTNNSTKFTSETGRAASNIRWSAYRENLTIRKETNDEV